MSRGRLLFITTSFENGAIPNVLLDLAPLWRDEGWDCRFLALEPLPESHASVKRCRSLGFPLTSLNVGPRSVIKALFRLRQAIQDVAPDLISTHLGRADIYTPWVKGRVPLVTTHHSVRQNAGRFTQFGYRLSDRLVAARTGVSQACNDSFLAEGFLRSPHTVIPNPLDLSRLVPRLSRDEFRRQFGWTGQDRVLAVVGRLIPVKDHRSLFKALALLRDRVSPGIKLLVAGDGPLRAELEAQAVRLALTDSIRFLGAVESVADVYGAADGLVFPSLWEGLGLVILEAWSLGCPVAASSIPAVREFVTDGENGVLFEPENPEALADGIQRLLEDPGRATNWTARGQALVRDRCSPREVARRYGDLFDRLIREFRQP